MTPQLFSELRRIRNEIAHGSRTLDPATLAVRLSELGLSIPAAELPEVIATILKAFGGPAGYYQVPQLLLQVMAKLLEGRSAGAVCDPWAGFGAVLVTVRDAAHATKAFAFTQNEAECALGRVLVSTAEWQLGQPLQLLNSLKTDVDVVASILPFGAKSDRSIVLTGLDGNQIELRDDLGNLILVSASSFQTSKNKRPCWRLRLASLPNKTPFLASRTNSGNFGKSFGPTQSPLQTSINA